MINIFSIAFSPIQGLINSLSFFKKFFLIMIVWLLPLGLLSYYVFNDLSTRMDVIEENKISLHNNHNLYKMILLVHDYELSAQIFFDDTSSISELKKTQNKLDASASKLLVNFDEIMQETCENYYKQANFSLLSENKIGFLNYTNEYKSYLYKHIVSVEGLGDINEEVSLDVSPYLLSVELPYSMLLISKTLINPNTNNLLIHIGSLKASTEKTDLLLHKSSVYENLFEESNLKYKVSIEGFIQSLVVGSSNRLKLQDTTLSFQLSLYNALQNNLNEYLEAKLSFLKTSFRLYLFINLVGIILGLFFMIASYKGIMASIQTFKLSLLNLEELRFNTRILDNTKDEFGSLGKSFNLVAQKLEHEFMHLNEYKKAVDASAIILKTDLKGRITYVNAAYEKISGYAARELIGSTHRLLKSNNTSEEQIDELWEHLNDKKMYKTIFENISKSGKSFFVESTIVPILDHFGKVSEFISIMFDLTPLYRKKERLQSQLYIDELTGLPNRLKLISDIEYSKDAKLVVINIDGFKEINTIYGEHIGDMALRSMAKEIKNALNTRHLQLYKLSADEFAILAGKNINIRHFKEDVTMLSHFLSHIKLQCDEHLISVRLSLGAAISELHHKQRPLISMADMALKEAKRKMKPYVFYNDLAADEDLEKNYKMVHIIEQAIKDDKISCSYQGIINAKTGKVEKYEALMRLEDSNGNIISPSDFVSIAKRARYYPRLTQKVVQEALFTFLHRSESISINISIDDMMDDATYSFILDALRNCGCAHRVVFELLETEEIEFNKRVIEFTSGVKKLGAQIAIDDFGSGYSNYAYLMKLGVDILKIDASLIKEVHENEHSKLIVSSIINIAHELGMKTVAEYVYNKEIQDIMTEMGVDFLQGYYLHKPTSSLPEEA